MLSRFQQACLPLLLSILLCHRFIEPHVENVQDSNFWRQVPRIGTVILCSLIDKTQFSWNIRWYRECECFDSLMDEDESTTDDTPFPRFYINGIHIISDRPIIEFNVLILSPWECPKYQSLSNSFLIWMIALLLFIQSTEGKWPIRELHAMEVEHSE
jgi:hypothetical protein